MHKFTIILEAKINHWWKIGDYIIDAILDHQKEILEQASQLLQGALEVIRIYNEKNGLKSPTNLEETRNFEFFNQTGLADQKDLFYKAERSLLANKLILADLTDKPPDQINFASLEGKDTK